jgi:hypothetical protein
MLYEVDSQYRNTVMAQVSATLAGGASSTERLPVSDTNSVRHVVRALLKDAASVACSDAVSTLIWNGHHKLALLQTFHAHVSWNAAVSDCALQMLTSLYSDVHVTRKVRTFESLTGYRSNW